MVEDIGRTDGALRSEEAFLAFDLSTSQADLIVRSWRGALAYVAQRFVDAALDGEQSVQRTFARGCLHEAGSCDEAALWVALRLG